MRNILLSAAILGLTACTTSPQQASYDARSEAKLQQHLAGKSAGAPVSCLPRHRSGDMIRIDDDTVLFRDGANRLYRNETVGSCNGLGNGNYVLVTKSPLGQLCEGDIAQMVDLNTGIQAGGCTLGAFVPYTRSGA